MVQIVNRDGHRRSGHGLDLAAHYLCRVAAMNKDTGSGPLNERTIWLHSAGRLVQGNRGLENSSRQLLALCLIRGYFLSMHRPGAIYMLSIIYSHNR